MVPFKTTDCFLILGRRGCGKSSLTKKILNAYPRRIIIDSLYEYEGAEIVYNFNEFCEKLQIKLRENSETFEVIFRIPHDSANSVEIFNQTMKVAMNFGNCLIVCEEIRLFSNIHSIPSHLTNALLIGRHHNIGMIFTCQRAGEIHKTIFSQCNHIFIGQMHERNDLLYLKQIFSEKIEELPQLPVGEFIYFSQNGEISKIKNELDQK